MYFEILQRSASLAAPTVALQYSLAECRVQFRIESQPRSSLTNQHRRRLLLLPFGLFWLRANPICKPAIVVDSLKRLMNRRGLHSSPPAAQERAAVKHFPVRNRFVQPDCTFGHLTRPRTLSRPQKGPRKFAFLSRGCPVLQRAKKTPSSDGARWGHR